jgi:hypothetical protein
MKNINTIVRIHHDFGIAPGVMITLDKKIPVPASEIAESLRWFVKTKNKTINDPGVDWFYCEDREIVFLGKDPDWIASNDKNDIFLMKAADVLDGSDFSAIGNGIE